MSWRTPLRILTGVAFIAAGTLHFVQPKGYRQIVPPWIPNAKLMVEISGVAEIAGGVGLLVPSPPLRRAAGWGLVALLAAVFPANLDMAQHPEHSRVARRVPAWALWVRLPVQAVLVAEVLAVSGERD